MSAWAQWLVIGWSALMIVFLSIGGFFMFRKFLFSMPRVDGPSVLERRRALIEQSLPLWTDEGKRLLNALVAPVPSLFRAAAKEAIAAKIAELALERGLSSIDPATIVEGYIRATPRQDHRHLIRRLHELGIDASPYRALLDPSGRWTKAELKARSKQSDRTRG
ncbi:DUF2621 family protein [Hydrogenibacillus schlegelii]|uniref:DUF2621 domain-containing protein n=1 Tax=Hydrogenibacillus schlegelii TaxID=1484 RepID=A0A2T5GEW4_HYDSH|nr:DUF2621 family protein [Hydrogenibacillus schlegelii]PTQ54727.1 MAG: hypothetical protein HSCHL_2318 [Hydrogenibacillus schlegelii]